MPALKALITIISLLAVAALLGSCASEDIPLSDQVSDQGRAPGEATPPPATSARSGWTW
jgi:hypothetical protein